MDTTTGKLTHGVIVANSLAFPTGLVVGTASSGTFLYAANQNGNSVTQFKLKATNGALSDPVTFATGKQPQFLAIPAS